MVFQRPHSIGLAPTEEQGVRITTRITLTSTLASGANKGTVVNTDMMIAEAENAINNVQTMYVDASQTQFPFVLFFPETHQTIFISALTQGYYPVAVGQLCQIQAYALSLSGSDNATVSVLVQFLNVPVPPCVWAANGVPV